jgi:serine/threonine-protein kinase RsbT
MILKTEVFEIRNHEDVVKARQKAREFALELKFGLVDQTKIVTATSELARNTLIYGGGGALTYELISEGARLGLKLTFVDEGPGIHDLELALKDGYTTGNGLGLGLGGARRLMNDFHISSIPGMGTTVTATRWR